MEIRIENSHWAINHARVWTIDASGMALSFIMNTTIREKTWSSVHIFLYTKLFSLASLPFWTSAFKIDVYSRVLVWPGQHGIEHGLENPPQKQGELPYAALCTGTANWHRALYLCTTLQSLWQCRFKKLVSIPAEERQQRETGSSQHHTNLRLVCKVHGLNCPLAGAESFHWLKEVPEVGS